VLVGGPRDTTTTAGVEVGGTAVIVAVGGTGVLVVVGGGGVLVGASGAGRVSSVTVAQAAVTKSAPSRTSSP
jgi:hypothetical protein